MHPEQSLIDLTISSIAEIDLYQDLSQFAELPLEQAKAEPLIWRSAAIQNSPDSGSRNGASKDASADDQSRPKVSGELTFDSITDEDFLAEAFANLPNDSPLDSGAALTPPMVVGQDGQSGSTGVSRGSSKPAGTADADGKVSCSACGFRISPNDVVCVACGEFI